MSMMSQKCHALLFTIKDFYLGCEGEKLGKKGGRRKGYYYISYTGFWTQVRENITELPVGNKLLSQMFRQFIRRAQTGTNNKDM